MDIARARQLHTKLLAVETNGDNAPDLRRLASTDRQRLHVALERAANHAKNPKRTPAEAAEADRSIANAIAEAEALVSAWKL
jgi:hypothetical protein